MPVTQITLLRGYEPEVQERLVRAAWSELRPAGKEAIGIDAMQPQFDADAAHRIVAGQAEQRMIAVGVIGMEHPFDLAAQQLTAQHREIGIGIDHRRAEHGLLERHRPRHVAHQ